MITSLSPEKIAKFPEYVDKWTRIGQDTRPLDKAKATAAVNRMYECGSLKPPEKIVFCTGPTNAILTINMYMYKKENPKATKAEVIEYVKKNCYFTTCGYGQHDAGWLSFYDYFDRETEIKGLEIAYGLMDMAHECGWYWAYEDICFVAEKPIVCKVNDVNMLHCANGPAIAYNDGTKIFAYDGVIMDEKTIMQPETITVDEINDTENEEQKRVKIEIYGVSKYLVDMKASIVDMDVVKVNPFDENSHTMPRALMKDSKDNLYLVGTDGSTQRTYFMNVPVGIKTCVEAHNAISPIDESNIIAAS